MTWVVGPSSLAALEGGGPEVGNGQADGAGKRVIRKPRMK